MQKSIPIHRADATAMPLLKKLLIGQDLPIEDLTHVETQGVLRLFYSKEGKEILSCGGYEQYGEIGLLRSVAIRADRQGTGLGKKWMHLLLEKGRELNLKEVYLLTTTAEGFFLKLGFNRISREDVPQPIQNSQEFSSLCPSSATIMYLRLFKEV